MPSLKHTHTYVKHETRKGYMRCFDPHCSHFCEKQVLLGKASHCTDCGTEFILDREDLKRARPKCLKCSGTKQAKTYQAAAAIMEEIGKQTELLGEPEPMNIFDKIRKLKAETEKESSFDIAGLGKEAMNPTSIRIARRIVAQMLSIAEQQVDINLFMGYGLCLAVCYEEMMGRSANDKKPQELMEWAKNLPEEKYPRVAAY